MVGVGGHIKQVLGKELGRERIAVLTKMALRCVEGNWWPYIETVAKALLNAEKLCEKEILRLLSDMPRFDLASEGVKLSWNL